MLAVAAFLICAIVPSRAGGPAFVAGSGYNTGVEGQPLIWAGGSVQYYTDQGNLSPILTGPQADAFVATAFSAWTTIPGVALTATQAGHLAEDVNGSNIETNGQGVVTDPADITPDATGTPVGIVYDYDGTVTDAILGEGAGDIADCFTNAVYGSPDNFSSAGNIVHALVVINGICAATSAQLPDVQYRLVRVVARTVGLGRSQANLNVITGNPPPTQAQFAGFPVMHFTDPITCVPISQCYPNAALPKMDDMEALTRLYPASNNPQPAGRIYGSVYFTDASGIAGQQMQGVNVVARLMVAGLPSGQYVVTSVSGFLFCGNAGNIINGYLNANGQLYSQWGSNDPTLEGFFDLGELMIPSGQTIAEYQLSVEALDPVWSMGVEPYGPTQVTPSGTFAPVVVTVTNGSNAERDILMLQDEVAETHPGSGSTYANPAALPQGGAWGSWISGYGSADFFEFTAQANRTASVAVTALNEAGAPTENKLLPVIGIWELSDESGDPAPAATSSAFNSTTFGMTRLDAQFTVSETYRVAVADFRGDGRPDYFYQASLLYSDSVTPARLSLAGGVTTLAGIGFNPGLQVSVAGNAGTTLSATASRIQATVPAGSQDGIATLQVTNPVSGAFSQMIGALTYGAAATDLLLLLQGAEPSTPVGAQAANPIRVGAVAADGVTPVSGATIAWSSNNGALFSVCGGAAFCSILTDEAGESSSWVTPTATGPSTITVALAPATYSPPQSQLATLVGTSTTLDLAAVTPTRWVGQGATIAVPLTVEALDLGVPIANVTVNFTLTQGTAALSAGSAITNSSGFATITANLTNQNASVQVSACVAPANKPCQSFALLSTPASLWTLQTVSGSLQFVLTGQQFQPLVMRVTDGSASENPVMGVNVYFATTLTQISESPGGDGVPVLLGSSQVQIVSTQGGLASISPSSENVGPCDVFIAVTAGVSSLQLQMESLAAIVPELPPNGSPKDPPISRHPQPGVQPSAEQGATAALFAVPEGDPTPSAPSPAPAADPQATTCAELTPGDQGSSPTCPPVKSPEVAAPKNGTKPEQAELKAAEPANHVIPAESAIPQPAQPAAASWQPDDRRSCRSLAGDGPFF